MKKFKFEKIFTLSSIITLCVSVCFLVFGYMGIMPLNRFFLDLFLILAILAFGCVTSLSAIKMVMLDKKNIFGYVLLGMTALICLLWIICIFVASGLIDALVKQTIEMSHLSTAWGFVKVVIFLSLLQSLASLIIHNWLKYKKKSLGLQIALYACSFLVTLWLSIVVLSIVVTENGFTFTANWFLNSAFFVTIFVLALVFSGVLKLILINITRREERELVANAISAQKNSEANKPKDLQEETKKEEQELEKQNDPWSQE